MGIFSRTRDIIAANFNDMLDKADDPSKMIRMIILEMEETLVEVRASAARTIADQKEMRRHVIKLDRLQADFVDVFYCHRADPDTPMEETVWAMSDMVTAGKATYWGTSEWNADEIRHAIEIAERHHLHKPVTEQSQYNLLERDKVER